MITAFFSRKFNVIVCIYVAEGHIDTYIYIHSTEEPI